ncbi:MAG: trypsin-like peptidase domain-containing protein [Thermoguttaceae bacterium]|nr:trypsin-like peptidase domain-containing protein [Thermoguttaceae bacterium]
MSIPERSESLPPPVFSTPAGPGPVRRGSRTHLPALLVFLGGLIILLVVPYLAQEISYAITRGEERAKYEAAREKLGELGEQVSRYRLAAKVIEPSVVGIDTVRVMGPALVDEWSFFPQQPRFESVGQGSGVIIDQEGHILTNAHVVSQASSVAVRLSDGRVFRNVQILGADPVSDLAVLKIHANNLIAAEWGNSDELEVGDEVLAVGNPYGLARSVTAGIISAKDRRVDVENAGFRDFLQTDAAVNPGNSGGPLVNMKGHVVGINTAIVGQSYRGISFAIPSRLAQRVFERLTTTGIARGWLGVQMQDLTPELASQFGLKESRGVIVTAVVPDSPAAKAGILPGDVVVAVGGQPVRDSEDLRLAIARTKIGAQADVTLHREGKELHVSVTIEQRPERVFAAPR